MSLVTLLNISHGFSGKTLFQDVRLQVAPGDRVGLVGPNGSGKTTFLKLIMGQVSPDTGEVRINKGSRLGYLPQDIHETMTGTILQSLLHTVPGRGRLIEELSRTEQALEKNIETEKEVILAGHLAEIHQETADLDKQFPPHEAEKILLGLGFTPDDFEKPISSLSGGWKMRAALARLLYRKPELLLLDEPTNHLDIPSVRWFEEYLQDYAGAMLLVCHDRDFLNRQVNRILSLEPEGLRGYSGNYDFYLKARDEENRILDAKARNQEQKIREAKRFITRFKAKATKARQAQSKIKLIEKMALVETHQKQKTIRFSFPTVSRSGRDVLNIQKLTKGFDTSPLYRDLQLTVQRGDRIAIIGPNGSGKTTLLRMVAGEISPDQGKVALGHGVTMSYYAQHHSEMLDPGKTILEEVYQVIPHESMSFVRGVCGAFLFSGSDVDKSISILSGGEKARVSLAKILVKPGNLLVMDEPTNHLDIISSEILINALSEFNGTLLFVSHNQAFAGRLARKIWDIREEKIVEYPGSLYEYYDYLSAMDDSPLPDGRGETGAEEASDRLDPDKAKSRKMLRKEKAEKRLKINETLKPIKEKLLGLEKRIDELETRKDELEKELAHPDIFKDKERSLPLLAEYGKVKRKLEGLMGRWEYQQETLDAAKEELGLLEE
ncbi:MAG: ABC-F family ATP-binding cassette domain-containing protein [Deltaproteobacteria bacterium]|nr:ABC-F family ATP-binding cassette domain-containing protein [Deltaproteobacteria bacterium]